MTRLTVKEASELTGFSVSKIRKHIYRGASKLGQAFSKDDHGFWRADRRRLVAIASQVKRDHSDRAKKIGARFDEAEQKTLESLYKKAGLTQAEWLRVRALTDKKYNY